jgi:hypothetical protein
MSQGPEAAASRLAGSEKFQSVSAAKQDVDAVNIIKIVEENAALNVLTSCDRFNLSYVTVASKQQLDDKCLAAVANILVCNIFELKRATKASVLV